MSNNIEKFENEELCPQLKIFADAYVSATGFDRSFKYAAMQAGVPEDKASQQGYEWSQLPVVKNYWKSVFDAYSDIRRAMHIRSVDRLRNIKYSTVHTGEK